MTVGVSYSLQSKDLCACIEIKDIHATGYWFKSSKKPKRQKVFSKWPSDWNAHNAFDM